MNSTRDEKILNKFGKHLEKIREDKKLSLRKLADNADVDFSQIHRIEKGKTNPSLTMLLALSEGLGIPIEELIHF
ncbi:MAG: helix-turn-helix domain-containing protein [Chitinophagaceae bacterium]|nr:helix-turn-helix domain-containing protein [Chitinophagaceae bacterium]